MQVVTPDKCKEYKQISQLSIKKITPVDYEHVLLQQDQMVPSNSYLQLEQ
jgi:hypothetical protein